MEINGFGDIGLSARSEWHALLRRRRNLRRVPTTEEKPEVPISRDLRESWSLIRDPFLRASSNCYSV